MRPRWVVRFYYPVDHRPSPGVHCWTRRGAERMAAKMDRGRFANPALYPHRVEGAR